MKGPIKIKLLNGAEQGINAKAGDVHTLLEEVAGEQETELKKVLLNNFKKMHDIDNEGVDNDKIWNALMIDDTKMIKVTQNGQTVSGALTFQCPSLKIIHIKSYYTAETRGSLFAQHTCDLIRSIQEKYNDKNCYIYIRESELEYYLFQNLGFDLLQITAGDEFFMKFKQTSGLEIDEKPLWRAWNTSLTQRKHIHIYYAEEEEDTSENILFPIDIVIEEIIEYNYDSWDVEFYISATEGQITTFIANCFKVGIEMVTVSLFEEV